MTRAGLVGASALALSPLLACATNGLGSTGVAPTATPSVGTVTTGRYRIGWQRTSETKPMVTSANLAALAQGYGSALTVAAATEQGLLQQDLQVVGKVSDTYGSAFKAALTRVGVDVAQLQADLEALGKLTDPQALAVAKKTLEAKYLPYYPKAYAEAGMNRDAIVNALAQQIRPRVTNPKTVTTTLTGAQLGWGWTGLQDETSTTPPSCALDQRFTPPYNLEATTSGAGGTTGPGTSGEFDVDIQGNFASSEQVTQSAGVGIAVDHAATHVRVEADITVRIAHTIAIALLGLGYGSSEVILRLQLLDGATVLVEQRQSLIRSIAAVFSWDVKDYPAGPLRLAVDYPRPGGAPTDATLSAVVQVEVWTGAGGAASTSSDFLGRVDSIRAYTAC